MKQKFGMIIICLFLVAGLILTSCSENTATSTTTATSTATASPTTTTTVSTGPKKGGNLVILMPQSPGNAGGWLPDLQFIDQQPVQPIFDGLVRGDSEEMVIPWMAESFEVADDLKSVTFRLKKGIKFHDGTDLNAAAVKWNLDNMIESKRESTWTSVDVLDDYTVRLNLSEWHNIFWAHFADSDPDWFTSPTAFQENGIDWLRNNPIGTGPFKFDSFQKDVSYKMVRNPDYFIEGQPYVDSIEIKFIKDPLTMKAAMQAGEGDIIWTPPGSLLGELKDMGLEIVLKSDYVYCLIPDSANSDSPYAKKQVREAVEYAIDRDAIAKVFSYEYWKAPNQIPPPTHPSYNPDFPYAREYDPDKAIELLNEAGYPDGFDTTIVAQPTSDRDMVVAIQSFLLKVGIRADIQFPENQAKYTEDVNTLHNMMAINFTGGSTFENIGLYYQFNKNSIFNQNWLRTTEFNNLLDTALNTKTEDPELVRAVTDYMSQQASIIPFLISGNAFAIQPYVQSPGFDKRGYSTFWTYNEVWLDK